MASLGKKFLSAFVEVNPPDNQPASGDAVSPQKEPTGAGYLAGPSAPRQAPAPDNRMMEYFDKLFSDANIPGPDYFEFSKMVAALKAIPDEFTRFSAAFAGLQVQGLTKEKLLSTAGEYLKVLDTDADHFHSTVEAALQEKVRDKKAGAEEKATRIQALTKEIDELQSQIAALQAEIRDSEQKITGRSGDYTAESAARKQQIADDIEKIKQYIRTT
ncbi:MAG TPA: hypothetical protein VHD83_09535 [Puia sp.]|nr:hypothetical protein [Puia sp.]